MPDRIYVPDEAPFSPEQREWLNRFFEQMYAEQAGGGEPAADGPALPVTILVGSQTGNAEGCAKKMAKAMNGGRFEPKVVDMAQYDKARLPNESHLLVITSTYGDGEPPDNATDLYEYLHSDQAPQLAGVKYSVLSLGDTEYPDFCKCGIDFDNRLATLGAERIYERVDCDVDYDEAFANWRKGVLETLGGGTALGEAAVEAEEVVPFGKKNPFPAAILRNFNLNGESSPKETYHVELSLEESGLEYEVGDALGVFPRNDEALVDEVIANLPFNVKDEVPLPDGGEASLREALIHNYDLRSLTPKFLKLWQERSGSPYLRSVVESDDRQVMNDFCWGREVIDLVVDYPADFSDGEDFVSVLKKLQPRLYSIASSPKAHPGEVHLTIAIVRYESYGRPRGGVCSTFIADRSDGVNPGVFVHHNKAFRLPDDGDTPIIMVGPGTGIAPFRAFLEERRETGAKGKNWLFFGSPYRATDFLYEEELTAMEKSGLLSRLDLAFSRDQKEKVYVQHLMEQSGEEIWNWLREGASFYVCGDASRMAKDVDATLNKIAQVHGGLSAEDAAAYLKELKKEKRYSRDVY